MYNWIGVFSVSIESALKSTDIVIIICDATVPQSAPHWPLKP